MNKLNISILGVLLVMLASSCQSAPERINETLHKADSRFIDSKRDYMYNDSKTFVYEIMDGDNYLANEVVRKAALNYANAEGQANYYKEMAYDVMHNHHRILNYKLDPQWYNKSKEYESKASFYKEEAQKLKSELESLVYNMPEDSNPDGIWVYHKLTYKEYVYQYYAGPYKKEMLYFYSKDGKTEFWSSQVNFSDEDFTRLLQLLNIKYTLTRFNDYK